MHLDARALCYKGSVRALCYKGSVRALCYKGSVRALCSAYMWRKEATITYENVSRVVISTLHLS
jgi:hypothetical protein